MRILGAMKSNTDGTCPHCTKSVRFREPVFAAPRRAQAPTKAELPQADHIFLVHFSTCPSCQQIVIFGEVGGYKHEPGTVWFEAKSEHTLWPRSSPPPEVHPDVPARIRRDFEEATACLGVSLNASAALARRCLQAIVRAQGHKAKNLEGEIENAKAHLPAYIGDAIDQIRRVGNFAAHEKLDDAGTVVDVDADEAHWLLHLIGLLLDHYYALPAKVAAQQAKLAIKAPGSDPLNKAKPKP